MQWPSEIGYPKVRQSESFWTIIRMLIFLSIIFSIALLTINTIQEEGSWTDIPSLPPSPAQVAPAFGDSGLLEVGAVLPLGIRSSFFQFLNLESFEIGEIINSFSPQESQPKYSKRAFYQYITYILLIIFTRVPDLLWFHIAMRLQLVVNPSVMSKLIKGHIAGIVTTISNGVKIILQF